MKSFFAVFTVFLLTTICNIYSQDFEKQQADLKSKFYRQLLKQAEQITPNQESYDVSYYSIDITPDPESKLLTGKAEIVLQVTAASLDRVELNFWDGMEIDSLYVSNNPGAELAYTQSNDLLGIELGRTYSENEMLSISIAYNGYPEDSGYDSFVFLNLAEDFIGTFNQPYKKSSGAGAWWPCKDYPYDKADSIDIRVTVPNALIVASNGVLKSKTQDGDMTTYWWHHGYPIATYLVSLAIYPFFEWSDTYVSESGKEMPIVFYTFSDTNNASPSYLLDNYKKTRSMMEFFASIFGEYPFLDEKYGHAEWHKSFALEHQTMTSMGDPTERRVAHELSHSWWGNMITCRTYNHVWLNEGFASYAESMWFEHTGAIASASEYQLSNYVYKGPGTIYVEDVYQDDIYEYGLTYQKASWVLHMLRHLVGDSTFFEIFKAYYSAPQHQYKTATTEDFQAICEQVSGLKLDKFFQQWIYGEYYPRYSSGWQYKHVENGYRIKIEIKQTQKNTGLFWMPVDINVLTESGSELFVAWDSLQTQTFEFDLMDKPLTVQIDPDNWILRETSTHLQTPYTESVRLNNPFQSPGTGLLKIFGTPFNPDEFNLSLSVIIESLEEGPVDSIVLYDDGNIGDEAADDGVFSGSWLVPEKEAYYKLNVLTFNQDSGYINYQSNLSQFTTIGPVSLDGYITATGDSVTQPGEDLLVKLMLKNNSMVHTIPNISADLVSNDTCISSIIQDNPYYGTLSPGETKTTSGTYLLKISPDCQTPHTPLVQVQIKSDDNLFWIDTLHFGIISDIANKNDNIVNKFTLEQNYPNPFNNSTMISYRLAKGGFVKLFVFNLLGQKVATLLSEEQSAGQYDIKWNAGKLTSGIYYYRLETEGFNQTHKMILMK